MNRADAKKIMYLMSLLIIAFLGIQCAAPDEELRETSGKTTPKDYVYPLTEINAEKVFAENRGLKVLLENATMVHDYYRGGVQEKEEGDRLLKEGNWEEARSHLETSNQFRKVVLKVLPDDEAHRNIYGDQEVIFLPNLLIADNDLKLATAYRRLKKDEKAVTAKEDGEFYLGQSLKRVKTEWADQIKKGFEDESHEK